MTRQVFWTKKVLEAFIEEGNLNERQIYIIKSRAKGELIATQAAALNLSVDQINKEIAALKRIYDATQIHSDVLPPRKNNRSELFNTKKD